MSDHTEIPSGNQAKEAIDSLRGYVYQIYQTALAWTDIEEEEVLFIEVADDFSIAAKSALQATQVKDTKHNVTINSPDIISSIDNFVRLTKSNQNLSVSLRHLTTSQIGLERKKQHRIDSESTLLSWRKLARAGDLSSLRKVLRETRLSEETKEFVEELDDDQLRERFLQRIHFDCGAPSSKLLRRQLVSRVSHLVRERGGLHSQALSCVDAILMHLLRLSANESQHDRLVDRSDLEERLEEATHVAVNRADLERQSRLVSEALSANLSSRDQFSDPQLQSPSLASEVPLPRFLACREHPIERLQRSLENTGFAWISGSAGMGKSVAARVLASKNHGDWANLNLRGKDAGHSAQFLMEVSNVISRWPVRGVIIDDADSVLEYSDLDPLRCLLNATNRADALLVIVSSNRAPSELIFEVGAHMDIDVTLTEFTEDDIKEILRKAGVQKNPWARYIHLVSGGGHPQLAIAFMQSMMASGWDARELQSFDALLKGSPVLEDVRKRTRKRLLQDLPEERRILLERLSLKSGDFGRELVFDLSNLEPKVPNSGNVLDDLVGSWIDQLEGDRFSISPLLSNYAMNTLGSREREKVQYAIAESLVAGKSIDLVDMNSAALAARAGGNRAALLKLSLLVIGADLDNLEMMAHYVPMFTFYRADEAVYQDDPVLNHVFRGAQLLLVNAQDDTGSRFQEVLDCFSKQSSSDADDSKKGVMELLVYSKLLLQTSKAGLGLGFLDILSRLEEILRDEGGILPEEALVGLRKLEGMMDPLGFFFINQARQLRKLSELPALFEFLGSCAPRLRNKFLSALDRDELEVDMLVTGPFLREHREGTIEPVEHSGIFAKLEESAAEWGREDIAVCCRKYQCIILDEYGNDEHRALSILEAGLEVYGQFNVELVRAKAKIFHRADKHASSLELSRELLDRGAPLNRIETAFLARDAAISAERQGEFDTARKYYLLAAEAAEECDVPDMVPFSIGIRADAALVSWKRDDLVGCLQEFKDVLVALDRLPIHASRRAAHCHAATRHVLLWMQQDVSGDRGAVEGDKGAQIFPGCVSNPEPHQEIAQRYIAPIEMAWYMLGAVENYALVNVGVTGELDQHLPKGRVLEGQALLGPAMLHQALVKLDVHRFIDALEAVISCVAYTQSTDIGTERLDLQNVKYACFLLPDKIEQQTLVVMVSQFVLVFSAMCVFNNRAELIDVLAKEWDKRDRLSVPKGLFDGLKGSASKGNYYEAFAHLIYVHANNVGTPLQTFDLSFKTLEISLVTRIYRPVMDPLLKWLSERWAFIKHHQLFHLKSPSIHKPLIDEAFGMSLKCSREKVVLALSAILPALAVSNQEKLKERLAEMSEKQSDC